MSPLRGNKVEKGSTAAGCRAIQVQNLAAKGQKRKLLPDHSRRGGKRSCDAKLDRKARSPSAVPFFFFTLTLLSAFAKIFIAVGLPWSPTWRDESSQCSADKRPGQNDKGIWHLTALSAGEKSWHRLTMGGASIQPRIFAEDMIRAFTGLDRWSILARGRERICY